MWTNPESLRPRTSLDADPQHIALRRFRTAMGPSVRMRLVPAVLALAVAGSMDAAVSVRTHSAHGYDASDQGLCLEAATSLVDPGAWNEVLDAVTVAAQRNTDFFPGAVVVSIPDLTQPWDPGAFPTVKIGIRGTGGSDPRSSTEELERLAATDCLSDDSEWTTTISHGLVLAAAERMLADARLPHDDDEPLVPRNAKADIDVEFYPDEQRVRTILDWSKPVLWFEVGGLCWIDDVLGADDGDVVVSSEADTKVSLGGEAGCALFQEFLGETGAGERAIDLLPTQIALADGTVLHFVVESVEVHGTEVVMAGSIEIR